MKMQRVFCSMACVVWTAMAPAWAQPSEVVYVPVNSAKPPGEKKPPPPPEAPSPPPGNTPPAPSLQKEALKTTETLPPEMPNTSASDSPALLVAEPPPAFYEDALVDALHREKLLCLDEAGTQNCRPKTSNMRIASYALFGLAGAAAGTGTALAVVAHNSHKDYKRRFAQNGDTRIITPSNAEWERHGGNLTELLAAADKQRRKVSSQKTAAIAAFSAAGAVAATATVLFFLSPERSPSLGFHLAPTENGALLGFHGVWP